MAELNSEHQRIRDHWRGHGDLDALCRELASRGLTLETAPAEQLASFDQMHAGQLAGMREHAAWIGIPNDARVLDVGSGLGGPARFLAAEQGCRVTALDVSPELTEAGAAITSARGLAERVEHVCGPAEGLEPSRGFDLVLIQHVDMQVADKAGLYEAAAGALAPGGRVAWFDWMAGTGGAPLHPLIWSDDGALTHICTRRVFEENLVRAGLCCDRYEDVSDRAVAFWERTRAVVSVGLSRATGDDWLDRRRRERLPRLIEQVDNLIRSLREERLVAFFAVARPR